MFEIVSTVIVTGYFTIGCAFAYARYSLEKKKHYVEAFNPWEEYLAAIILWAPVLLFFWVIDTFCSKNKGHY